MANYRSVLRRIPILVGILDWQGESTSVIRDSMNQAAVKTIARYVHLDDGSAPNALNRLLDLKLTGD